MVYVWDYRAALLDSDATFTLYALLMADTAVRPRPGAVAPACSGRKPSDLQIMYGMQGERRLTELELNWLPGMSNQPRSVSAMRPAAVSVGCVRRNDGHLHQARELGLAASEDAWRVQHAIMEFLETAWDRPDEGIWEVRGPRWHFTHSKVMAWVAVDRAVKAIERCHVDGPLERWRALRETIHEQVCREGYDSNRGTFVQYYRRNILGRQFVDDSARKISRHSIPACRGRCTPSNARLTVDGLVMRYQPTGKLDGLPGEERMFPALFIFLAGGQSVALRTRGGRAPVV